MNLSTPVPFHGNTLYLVEHNGEVYTPMKPIVDGMGLDWKTQFRKLKQGDGQNDHTFKRWGITEIVIPTQGGLQKMTCLLLRKLAGWLYSISPNKVRPELRDKICTYQSECDDVLWDYWTKGQATNPHYRSEHTREAHAGGLSCEQQDAIKAHHKALVTAAPAERQGKLAIALWSSVKSKFGVSYKDVPSDDFVNIISLMSRVAIEGEWLPAQKVLTLAQPAGYVVSDSEAADLHGMFTMVDMMRETLRTLEQPLRDLHSPLESRVYDGWHEIGLFLPGVSTLRQHSEAVYHQKFARFLR